MVLLLTQITGFLYIIWVTVMEVIMECGGSVVSEAALGFNGCKVVSSILTGSAHLQP